MPVVHALPRRVGALAAVSAATGAGVYALHSRRNATARLVGSPLSKQAASPGLIAFAPGRQGGQLDQQIAMIALGAGAIIGLLLLMSWRTASRAERTEDFIKAVQATVNSHVAVKRTIGNVFGAGHFDLHVQALEASGWFTVAAPGNVPGRALVEAKRPNKKAPWSYDFLALEINKKALDARNKERADIAASAGYGAAAASAIAGASTSAMDVEGVSIEKDEDGNEKLVIRMA